MFFKIWRQRRDLKLTSDSTWGRETQLRCPVRTSEFTVFLPIFKGHLVGSSPFQLCSLCSSYWSNWLSSPGWTHLSGSNRAPVLSPWFSLGFRTGIPSQLLPTVSLNGVCWFSPHRGLLVARTAFSWPVRSAMFWWLLVC